MSILIDIDFGSEFLGCFLFGKKWPPETHVIDELIQTFNQYLLLSRYAVLKALIAFQDSNLLFGDWISLKQVKYIIKMYLYMKFRYSSSTCTGVSKQTERR